MYGNLPFTFKLNANFLQQIERNKRYSLTEVSVGYVLCVTKEQVVAVIVCQNLISFLCIPLLLGDSCLWLWRIVVGIFISGYVPAWLIAPL